MTCPKCQQDFDLTWTRYLRAPTGKVQCPLCAASLRIRHQWMYWTFLAGLFAIALTVALTLTALDNLALGLLALVPIFVVGLLLDRYMESRFGMLVLNQ